MTQIEVRLNPDVTPAGSDLSIVNAARRSFNKRSDWEVKVSDSMKLLGHKNQLKEKDKRLLEFLARGMTADDWEYFVDKVSAAGELYAFEVGAKDDLVDMLWDWRNTPTHDTPFNHTFISFEVKAPIFVSRQMVKHEYLIVSEFSRRYIDDGIEFYQPDFWRKQHEDKKQGSTTDKVAEYLEGYHLTSQASLDYFNELISMGVAIEQARMVLPLSTMTEWTWSGTLGAFAKMCTLRLAPDAQYETRLVAEKVYDYLCDYYPIAAPALVKGPR